MLACMHLMHAYHPARLLLILHACFSSCTHIILHACFSSCTVASHLACLHLILHACFSSCTLASHLARLLLILHACFSSCTLASHLARLLLILHACSSSCTLIILHAFHLILRMHLIFLACSSCTQLRATAWPEAIPAVGSLLCAQDAHCRHSHARALKRTYCLQRTGVTCLIRAWLGVRVCVCVCLHVCECRCESAGACAATDGFGE